MCRFICGPKPKPRPITSRVFSTPHSPRFPSPLSSFTKRAWSLRDRAKPKRRSTSLKKAVGLHPNFGLALNELGVQYLKRGELDKAAEAFTKVLQLSPDAPEPCLNLGIVLLNQKKFTEAEAQLRTAVKKNEHSFTAHQYFGISLIYVKNYPEAETELRRAIELGGPKASQAHYYLGGLYWKAGNFRQAADELETYLKLEPKAANADKVKTTVKELRSKS